MSSASDGGRPCRRTNAKMGRQYVRQSFSSASCAAGDSLCASSTTLQCVVVNAAARDCSLARLAVVEVTSSGAALTIRWNQKTAAKQAYESHSGFDSERLDMLKHARNEKSMARPRGV